MRRPPDGQEDALRQTKGFLAYVLLGIHGWAAMLQAWTRWPGTCGQQYFGAQAVMGLVVAGLFPLGWEPDPGIGVFYAYWLLTICAFGTLERSYKDRNGAWKYTGSFDADDLGSIVSLCQQADEKIRGLQEAQAAN